MPFNHTSNMLRYVGVYLCVGFSSRGRVCQASN